MPYSNVPIGSDAPDIVNAIIEIPKGSHSKYQYDEAMDEIKLDRILHSSMTYPTDYGFIPQTRTADGEQLDVLVLISEHLFSGCLVEVRPIGILFMEEDGGTDVKVISVAKSDPLLSQIKDVGDLDEQLKREIHHFFDIYKQLENKTIKVHNWHNKEEAYKIINEARAKFSK